MTFFSDFADLGLVLPLAAVVALALAAVGDRREAAVWALAVSGTFGTMLVLKLVAFVCIGLQDGYGLENPSGHAASGAVVYAGLLALIGGRFAPRVSIALPAGMVFGLIFGLVRVLERLHTIPDVLVGGGVGLAWVLVLARLAGPRRPDAPAYRHALVAAVALVAVLALHGRRLHAEAELRSFAAEIQSGWWSP